MTAAAGPNGSVWRQNSALIIRSIHVDVRSDEAITQMRNADEVLDAIFIGRYRCPHQITTSVKNRDYALDSSCTMSARIFGAAHGKGSSS